VRVDTWNETPLVVRPKRSNEHFRQEKQSRGLGNKCIGLQRRCGGVLKCNNNINGGAHISELQGKRATRACTGANTKTDNSGGVGSERAKSQKRQREDSVTLASTRICTTGNNASPQPGLGPIDGEANV
jgi:hypothetical protein